MNKPNNPHKKPTTSQSNGNHDQGTQNNQQGNKNAFGMRDGNTTQNIANEGDGTQSSQQTGENQVSNQGDGNTTHIQNIDNAQGLEYMHELVQQKDELINGLQEKRIQDASKKGGAAQGGGNQTNQQGGNTQQNNTNHPNSKPVNSQSGNGSTTHIDNSDNTKGLEYMHQLLREKDELINQLQEKRIKDALKLVDSKESTSYAKKVKKKKKSQRRALMTASLVIITSGILVVVNLSDQVQKKTSLGEKTPLKKAKGVTEKPQVNKKKNTNSQSLRTPANQKKAIPITGLPQKESFLATMKQLKTPKQANTPKKQKDSSMDSLDNDRSIKVSEGISLVVKESESKQFEANPTLERFIEAKPLGSVQGVKAPYLGQVFVVGGIIEVSVNLNEIGNKKAVRLQLMNNEPLDSPIFSVEVKSSDYTKITLPKLEAGLYYLEIKQNGNVLGVGNFLVR